MYTASRHRLIIDILYVIVNMLLLEPCARTYMHYCYYIFNVCIDDLSTAVTKCRTGCCIDDMNVTYLMYTDDLVVFSPLA